MHAGLKRKKSKTVIVDVQKIMCDALHYIDIARDHRYSTAHLLTFELASTSLHLAKAGFVRKFNKSELTQLKRS